MLEVIQDADFNFWTLQITVGLAVGLESHCTLYEQPALTRGRVRFFPTGENKDKISGGEQCSLSICQPGV